MCVIVILTVFVGMVKRVQNAKIACLDFSLQKTKMKLGVQVVINDPEKLDQIRQRCVCMCENFTLKYMFPFQLLSYFVCVCVWLYAWDKSVDPEPCAQMHTRCVSVVCLGRTHTLVLYTLNFMVTYQFQLSCMIQ